MELYRAGSFPPTDMKYIDTENNGTCSEEGSAGTMWASSLQPLTGLKGNALSALRPGASRFTCNGDSLRSSPSQQPLQRMVHPVLVTLCNDHLVGSAAAAISAGHSQVPVAHLPFWHAASGTAVASPFSEAHLQLPANGGEAAHLEQEAAFAENLLLEPSATQPKLSNELGEFDDPKGDNFVMLELPASPARDVPETALRPSAAAREQQIRDTDVRPQLQSDTPLAAPFPSSSVLPELVLDQVAWREAPVAEHSSGGACAVEAPAQAPGDDVDHSHGASSLRPTATNNARRAMPARSTRCGPAVVPAASSPSGLNYIGDSDCDSEVLERCSHSHPADTEVTSARHAISAAAQPQQQHAPAPSLGAIPEEDEAVAADEEAVAVPGPQEATRGKERRAATVRAVRAAREAEEEEPVAVPRPQQEHRGKKRRAVAVRAVRATPEDDDDEDYDEREGQGAGAGTRSQKKAKKANAPRQQPAKARDDVSCLNCHTTVTPQWRCGPQGPRTLCNACGVRFLKSKAQEELEKKKRQSHLGM